MAKPLEVKESDFDQIVLESKQPVLVDFWAPWCSPCLAIAPILDELAKEYEDKITIARLNVDGAARIATRYGIHSIPTLLIFKDGKPVQQSVGLKSKKELKQMVEAALKER